MEVNYAKYFNKENDNILNKSLVYYMNQHLYNFYAKFMNIYLFQCPPLFTKEFTPVNRQKYCPNQIDNSHLDKKKTEFIKDLNNETEQLYLNQDNKILKYDKTYKTDYEKELKKLVKDANEIITKYNNSINKIKSFMTFEFVSITDKNIIKLNNEITEMRDKCSNIKKIIREELEKEIKGKEIKLTKDEQIKIQNDLKKNQKYIDINNIYENVHKIYKLINNDNNTCIDYEFEYNKNIQDNKYRICDKYYEEQQKTNFMFDSLYKLINLVCQFRVLENNDSEYRSFMYNKPTYAKDYWKNNYGLKIIDVILIISGINKFILLLDNIILHKFNNINEFIEIFECICIKNDVNINEQVELYNIKYNDVCKTKNNNRNEYYKELYALFSIYVNAWHDDNILKTENNEYDNLPKLILIDYILSRIVSINNNYKNITVDRILLMLGYSYDSNNKRNNIFIETYIYRDFISTDFYLLKHTTVFPDDDNKLLSYPNCFENMLISLLSNMFYDTKSKKIIMPESLINPLIRDFFRKYDTIYKLNDLTTRTQRDKEWIRALLSTDPNKKLLLYKEDKTEILSRSYNLLVIITNIFDVFGVDFKNEIVKEENNIKNEAILNKVFETLQIHNKTIESAINFSVNKIKYYMNPGHADYILPFLLFKSEFCKNNIFIIFNYNLDISCLTNELYIQYLIFYFFVYECIYIYEEDRPYENKIKILDKKMLLFKNINVTFNVLKSLLYNKKNNKLITSHGIDDYHLITFLIETIMSMNLNESFKITQNIKLLDDHPFLYYLSNFMLNGIVVSKLYDMFSESLKLSKFDAKTHPLLLYLVSYGEDMDMIDLLCEIDTDTLNTVDTHPLQIYLSNNMCDIDIIERLYDMNDKIINKFKYKVNTHPLQKYLNNGGDSKHIIQILCDIVNESFNPNVVYELLLYLYSEGRNNSKIIELYNRDAILLNEYEYTIYSHPLLRYLHNISNTKDIDKYISIDVLDIFINIGKDKLNTFKYYDQTGIYMCHPLLTYMNNCGTNIVIINKLKQINEQSLETMNKNHPLSLFFGNFKNMRYLEIKISDQNLINIIKELITINKDNIDKFFNEPLLITYLTYYKYNNLYDETVNLLKGINANKLNKYIYSKGTHPLILYLRHGGTNISLINEFMQIQNSNLNFFYYDEYTHPLILYKKSGGNDENITCILSHINQKQLKEIESYMTKKYLKYKTKYMALRYTKNKNTHL